MSELRVALSKGALRHAGLAGKTTAVTRVLFLCGKARMRSPTAADIVRDWPGINPDFAGLSRDADEPVSADHIDWAEVIAVMETRHKKRLGALFGSQLKAKRVVVLDVPDRYAYGDPAPVARLTPALWRILQR